MIFIALDGVVYHNASVEATSKYAARNHLFGALYTIMPRWRQLRNGELSGSIGKGTIP